MAYMNQEKKAKLSPAIDVGYYVNINIGKWNKPYILVK